MVEIIIIYYLLYSKFPTHASHVSDIFDMNNQQLPNATLYVISLEKGLLIQKPIHFISYTVLTNYFLQAFPGSKITLGTGRGDQHNATGTYKDCTEVYLIIPQRHLTFELPNIYQ